MEPNAQNQPIIPDPNVPLQPTLAEDNSSGSKKIFFLLGLAAVIIIAGIGYFYYSKAPKIQNATVYNQPTIAPSVSPSIYQTNPKDTSNQAINQDTQATNSSLGSLDSSLNNVDQSLNDQQTNLQ